MSKKSRMPVALTIAGSDSGGGAGIQADLKTFSSLGVHGTCAITCVTAQNPRGISSIQACRSQMVIDQMAAVFKEFRPAAVKTGMVYSEEIIRVIVEFFQRRSRVPLIVDPVMVATSGRPLLKPSAIKFLKLALLPRATLVTPNLHEAGMLLERGLTTEEDLRQAARGIYSRFGCAVLVKGGHLKGMREAVDFFFDGKNELRLAAPFIKGVRTHGTGCAYSAAITAYLARGFELREAVTHAKRHVTRAIAGARLASVHAVLNNFS